MAMATSRATGRIAEINVTPMADVIIVLLIIFMVTIPLINDGPVRLAYAAVAPILDVCRRAGAEEIAFIATPRTRS